MRALVVVFVLIFLASSSRAILAEDVIATPQEILDDLMAANVLFADGNGRSCIGEINSDCTHPLAVVLMCSEALPDPHTIFDQEFGRVATVRNMGNILPLSGLRPDRVDVGSIEYAVVNQGVRVVIVLGHKGCAVIKSVIDKSEARGNLPAVYQVIHPAVTKAKRDARGDLLCAAVRNNVANTVSGLLADTFILRPLVDDGSIKIVGAIYDPETHRVELLEDR